MRFYRVLQYTILLTPSPYQALDLSNRVLHSRRVLELDWDRPVRRRSFASSKSLNGKSLSRMGSELRLDRPLDLTTFEGYGKVATLPDDAFALLARDRSKTVATSFCLDLW